MSNARFTKWLNCFFVFRASSSKYTNPFKIFAFISIGKQLFSGLHPQISSNLLSYTVQPDAVSFGVNKYGHKT